MAPPSHNEYLCRVGSYDWINWMDVSDVDTPIVNLYTRMQFHGACRLAHTGMVKAILTIYSLTRCIYCMAQLGHIIGSTGWMAVMLIRLLLTSTLGCSSMAHVVLHTLVWSMALTSYIRELESQLILTIQSDYVSDYDNMAHTCISAVSSTQYTYHWCIVITFIGWRCCGDVGVASSSGMASS